MCVRARYVARTRLTHLDAARCRCSLLVLACQVLPRDMAVWVNPGEVSVRVGDHGPVFPLATMSADGEDIGALPQQRWGSSPEW